MLHRLRLRNVCHTTYTRKYLEELAVDKVQLARQAELQAKNLQQEKLLKLPANDKNPENYVPVKMNHPLFKVDYEKTLVRSQCQFMQPMNKPIYPQEVICASRRHIISSIKKAKIALAEVRKKHVLDAINILESSHRKVAKQMVKTLYNLIDHATLKGMNPVRLFIHGFLIGKKQRFKSLRYHAKGRGCQMKTDFIQVKVVAYEKDEQEFYMDAVSGKCPPAFANLIRNELLDQRKDYKTIARFTGVTTSKGRQQLREMMKRRVHQAMRINAEKGTFMNKKELQFRAKYIEGLALMSRCNQLFMVPKENELGRLNLYRSNVGQEKA